MQVTFTNDWINDTKMTIPDTIAIDGPAASGKTTLACNLARELNFICLDTGIMYRAVTCVVLKKKVDPLDEQGVTRLAQEMQIEIAAPTLADGRAFDFLVNGEDITGELRKPEVEAYVSQVSAYPGVRQAMTRQQRRIGQRGKIIMVGRDIGTVVMPDADLKIYLVASLEERTRRRYEERIQRGEEVSLDEVRRGLERRDQIDSTRQAAPLKPADDAVVIDSDGLSIEEVLSAARKLIR